MEDLIELFETYKYIKSNEYNTFINKLTEILSTKYELKYI